MTKQETPRPKAGFHQTVRNIAANRLHFGLSHTAVEYLRRAAECVSPDDLKDGRTPWCYERVDDLALALGVDPRSIHNIEKQLDAIGFIERRPMANGHRGAKRCRRTGELLWAHGISLAPLVARRDELKALEQNRADRERTYRVTRQRVHALRGRLRETLAAALDYPVLATLSAQIWAIYDAAPARVTRGLFDLDDLTHVQAELSLAVNTLAEALDEAAGENPEKAVNISDASETGYRQKYLTTSLPLYPCSVPASTPVDENRGPGKRSGTAPCLGKKKAEDRPGQDPEHGHVARMTPHGLLDLAPGRWRDALEGISEIDWRTIGFVADARRAELCVSEIAWRTGVARMGAGRAALCLAILDTNRAHPTRPVRSVGGAFVAMTRRAASGELNLDPSIAWIMARKKARNARPEARPADGGHLATIG